MVSSSLCAVLDALARFDLIANTADPARAERTLLHNAIACYRPAQLPV